jgi:hypothetical protein
MALIREDTAERASMTVVCLVSSTIGSVLLSLPPTGRVVRRARRRLTTPAYGPASPGGPWGAPR